MRATAYDGGDRGGSGFTIRLADSGCGYNGALGYAGVGFSRYGPSDAGGFGCEFSVVLAGLAICTGVVSRAAVIHTFGRGGGTTSPPDLVQFKSDNRRDAQYD